MSDSIPVSVTILTKNSRAHLAECLASVRRCAEVIVLDNGSTDETLNIAREFPNVRLHETEFSGFGALKNLAASFAAHDWIFSLDSDEIVSPELLETLSSLPLQPDEIGVVLRKNYYAGKLIEACGWQNDRVARLYNRTRTGFSERAVHESLIADGLRPVKLEGFLKHHPYRDAAGLVDKMQFYSTLYAEENRFRKPSSAAKATLAGIGAFLKSYVLKKGWLYGAEGLLISVSNAGGAFYKYMKLREANRRLSTSLIITTYNREDALELTIKSALAQTEPPDEILIADDGSGDATRRLVERYQKLSPVPLVHCWQPDEGFRVARARNRAIAASTGEYLIIVDGDLILHPKFVESHKRAARRGAFLQGGRAWLSEQRTKEILAHGDAAPPPIRQVDNRAAAVNSPPLSRFFSRAVEHDRGVRSCNMSFWREDCLRVNGFNEDFEGWGREDSEFVVRLRNSGVRRVNLRFGGVAYHLHHPLNERRSLERNDAILQKTVETKLVRCENGIVKSE